MCQVYRKTCAVLLKPCLWFLLSSSTISQGHAGGYSGDQIKAVYLFNFSEFVRWPDIAFEETKAHFNYCSFSEKNKVVSLLKKVITNESAKGRKLVFRLIKKHQDLKFCQILYIHSTEPIQPGKSTVMSERNILTVGDAKGFAKREGMVELSIQQNRLQAVINVQRLKQAGLKASAKLLQLAKIIGEE